MSRWYRIELTNSAYSHYLKPVNGEKLWRKTSFDKFLPPRHRRMPRRPKKQRNREVHKARRNNSSEVSRKGRQMKCSKCGEYGYNKKPCRGPPNVSSFQLHTSSV